MKKLMFDQNGWQDYLFWQKEDKQMVKKINKLIKEILRAPYSGLGKPEALKGDLSGFWSRRISQEHRLVYAVFDDHVVVAQCRYHY